MFYLPIPSNTILDAFYDMIKGNINKALSESSNDKLKTYLAEDKIKQVITAAPQFHVELHSEAMTSLVEHFSDAEFKAYRKFRQNSKKTSAGLLLAKRYSVVKEVESVFNYDQFISRNKKVAYKLSSLLDRNTCTYCNRNYTLTIAERSNSSGIIRPTFDHWYDKKRYPILALSFFNLIPCCSLCNSSIKGIKGFSIDKHIHPYLSSEKDEYSFSFHPTDVYQYAVHVKSKAGSNMENTIRDLRLEEIYNGHANLELKDLMQLRYKYSEDYLDTLLNKTFNSFEFSKQEAYRLIFGTEMVADNFHKRPLSKFKFDILKELSIEL